MLRRMYITVIIAVAVISYALDGAEHLRTDAMYWDVIRTEHFTIVHPRGLVQKAREAAFFLEEGYGRISKDLDTQVKRKILVVLYRNQNEFE